MSGAVKAALIIAVALVVHGWFTGHRVIPIAGGTAMVVSPIGTVRMCTADASSRC